jgi:hypothetical protein
MKENRIMYFNPMRVATPEKFGNATALKRFAGTLTRKFGPRAKTSPVND